MARARFTRMMTPLIGLFLASGIATTLINTEIASASSYTVTETSLCGGAGSFQKLLAEANSNPGADTIEFTPGLQVAAWTCNTQPADIDHYPLRVDQSLTIIGHGATIVGAQMFLSSAGRLNDPGQCPSTTAGTAIVQPSVGFLEVGTYDVDNTGIELSVDGLDFNGMPSLFLVEKAASLTLTGSTADKTLSLNDSCTRTPIESRSGNVTLRDVRIQNSSTPALDVDGPDSLSAVIAGFGSGTLNMDHVRLTSNFSGRAVVWSGENANIVNSLIIESGGLWLQGANSNIVNTAFFVRRTLPVDRVVSFNGAVRVDASTFFFNDPICTPCDAPFLGIVTGGTGTFDFHTTAIGSGADYPGAQALLWGNTATGFTSDSLTWVQPTGTQDAAGITTILPNALTAAPGLPAAFAPGYFGGALADLTPLLGTLGTPGVLIDAVDTAECPGGASVVNPIDSSCITTDVFGNPRWDAGNGKRNVGAVQNVATPHLSVTSVDDGAVTVSWNRPTEPGSGSIVGYELFYQPVGSSDGYTQITIPGAGSVVYTVGDLVNGTDYEFVIVADYGSGTGPESNTVTATPLGPIDTPAVTGTGGTTSVQLSWTEPTLGGRTGIISYYVVYRPTGTTDWILGPGSITGRITTIPGLTPETSYEFAVFATTDDGANSLAGTAFATPHADELPPTGGNTDWLAALALLLIVAGAAMRRGTARQQR